MICEAIYTSLEAIPEALRDEFEQVDGKWQLKSTAVPGVGQLFNRSLAANEKKAVDQVKKRNQKISDLEAEVTRLTTELETAKDEADVVKAPGSKVLSKEDAESFDTYVKLGTPKDIQAKVEKLDSLTQELNQLRTSKTVAEIAAAANLNPEVLEDFLISDKGRGIQLETEDVTVRENGKDTITKKVVARVTKDENGKIIESKVDFLEVAKERMAGYQFEALTKGAQPDAQGKVASNNNNQQQPQTGVRLPNLGSANQHQPSSGGDGKSWAEKFNEERANKPNPLRGQPAAASK